MRAVRQAILEAVCAAKTPELQCVIQAWCELMAK